MGWPQWTWLGLAAVVLGMKALRDGEPDVSTHRFGVTFVCLAGEVALLWAGGFFG